MKIVISVVGSEIVLITKDELCEILFLKDMINVRDGCQTCNYVYNGDEVKTLIKSLCVQ